jgi:regulator of sirC expression with transglutaminase-like and TPR domain
VQATKEWIEHQTQIESEMIDARYNTYEGKPYMSRNKAHDELRDYLKPAEEKVDQLMRNSHILNRLNRIANTLDNSGLYNEANILTKVMRRLSQDDIDIK